MNTTKNDSYATINNGLLKLDDATWLLQLAFVIFTMQTGFGLLESGCVQGKNEVNIMMKNVIDVIFGGISYWIFGYGTSYGTAYGSNPVVGFGNYFVTSSQNEEMGSLYTSYIYQLSFATTATTIVSGSMAERIKLTSYVIFSFCNTIIYCLPARWIWHKTGFLYTLGVIDLAGSSAVHLVGGVSALVCAVMLGPRIGVMEKEIEVETNPINTLIGLFMLWWGWLAFNGSSALGISGGKWKVATKAVVNTLNCSIGGGISGIVMTLILYKGKYSVPLVANAVLCGLVSSTSSCAVTEPWEALLVGMVAGVFMELADRLVRRAGIDDPVSAVAVHGLGGVWGMLSTGFFCQHDSFEDLTRGRAGLLHNGGFYVLGVQLLACITIASWTVLSNLFILGVIKLLIGIRLEPEAELIGSDFHEHMIGIPDSLDEQYLEHCNEIFHRRRMSGLLTKEGGYPKVFRNNVCSFFRKIYKRKNSVHVNVEILQNSSVSVQSKTSASVPNISSGRRASRKGSSFGRRRRSLEFNKPANISVVAISKNL